MAEGGSQGKIPPSPGGRPMGIFGITLVTIYLVAVTIVVFHSLIVLWPPNRERDDRLVRLEQKLDSLTSDLAEESPALDTGFTAATPVIPATPAAEKPSETGESALCSDGKQWRAELFWFVPLCLSDEERLFLIVMFSGALGGLAHSLRSFYWYAGNRKLVLSWAGFYITLPILGAALATVFYVVVRGGFFSPQSEISDTSPFGFAAMAALIGMFTEQATEKLKEITETFFSKAPTGKDQAEPSPAAPTVSAVSPVQGTSTDRVTITGSGFAQGATVTFGGEPASNIQVAADGASLTADPPAAAVLGAVDVEVTNPDGKKGSLAGGFTYV
ncbi:MAG TPA: IPT/TIG domain-containing protein [Thermoanaerobaculia bacterium]|nr:IPT/TIG domain-containing protein [Thermoanaerobaculia bacterium]